MPRKSKKQKRRELKRKVLMIVGVVLFVVVSIVVRQFFQIRGVHKVADRVAYANLMEPKLVDEVEIKSCTDWSNPLYGWCKSSPLFPYVRLEVVNVKQGYPKLSYENGVETNLSTESRVMLSDRLWRVFFVGVNRFPDKIKYYGPFRY